MEDVHSVGAGGVRDGSTMGQPEFVDGERWCGRTPGTRLIDSYPIRDGHVVGMSN